MTPGSKFMETENLECQLSTFATWKSPAPQRTCHESNRESWLQWNWFGSIEMVKSAGSKKKLRELFPCVSLKQIYGTCYHMSIKQIRLIAEWHCHYRWLFRKIKQNFRSIYTYSSLLLAYLKLDLNPRISEFSVICNFNFIFFLPKT